jgi:hypothetical protein
MKDGKKSKLGIILIDWIDYIFYAAVLTALTLTSCTKEEEEICLECKVLTSVTDEQGNETNLPTEQEMFCFGEDEAHNIELKTFHFDSISNGKRYKGSVSQCGR